MYSAARREYAVRLTSLTMRLSLGAHELLARTTMDYPARLIPGAGGRSDRHRGRARVALVRGPGRVLMGDPDVFRMQRANQELTFGLRVLQFAEPDRGVSGDDRRTLTRVDDNDL